MYPAVRALKGSMLYTDFDRYEPPAIRRALPIEWAVGYLFGVWGLSNEMHPCPLPDHEDDTPSSNLWAADTDGIFQRFGCFGCGVNEDVIGLVRIARGVGFLDACKIAVEELIPAFEASKWTPSERGPVDRTARSHEELKAVLDRIRGKTVDLGDLQTFRERKGLVEVPLDYLTGVWAWSLFRTPAPVVVFPHADWDARLTGIRYRSVRRDGSRWTERGSRFPALYGAWRDRGRGAVLLCEGETDTVHGAWALRDVDEFDVLGLAAGAAQKPPEEAVERLRGRAVYLAFDADTAGRIADRRWRDALSGSTVLTVPIPDGEDLLSCGVPVSDLIFEAKI